jgi:hypothetical protein
MVQSHGGARPRKTELGAGRYPAAGQAWMAKSDEERQLKADKADMTASVAKHVRKTSDPTVQAAIGRKLRALYDEVANEPVPERFSELLKQLADQENQDR